MTRKQKKNLIRIIVSAALLVVLSFVPAEGWLRFALYMVPYLIVGYDILLKAWKGIIKGQVFDENFLMAVATIGAIVLGVLRTGDYIEAVAVMLFYQVGELFQSIAIGRSRKNISELMDIRPDYANIETDGHIEQVDPDEVEVGKVIVVRPGEKIPIDGIVESGTASLDTSALTGESVPCEVNPGDEVISGCIDLSGVLYIRTNKEFGESTVSKILEMVENATSLKSKSEAFISRFARVYTPVVCICALILALVPPLITMGVTGNAPDFGAWLYRALTFLVISCPCALVISIPLTFFAGIGGASNSGILIKGSNYLEALSKTSCVVFDKTGTLTKGVFEVTGIHHSTMPEERLLEYAAHAESASSHPVSRSIIKAYGKEPDTGRVSGTEEISGKGIVAVVDEKRVAAGNKKLMRDLNVEYHDCHLEGTVIHIAADNEYAGHIVISDVVRPDSAEAVRELKKCGVKQTVMLTGDNSSVAESVAKELGIDTVYSELLPGDKVEKLEELISRKTDKEKVAFVGDGINDAPVIRRADIGIAMGAMGSDAAIEAADIVLMDDDPMQIPKAIKISRKCMRIVWQNIIFAIGIKVVCLILGALGVTNMWGAIFADVGVMVIAVLNAVRALRVRNL